MAQMKRDDIGAIFNSELIRFGIVGLANTAFSYGIYAAGIYLGIPYYIASFLALILGIMVSFFTQGHLVFRAKLKGKFPYFVGMWAILYILNIGVIYLLVAFGLSYYLAGILAAAPVVIVSFILQKLFVFKR